MTDDTKVLIAKHDIYAEIDNGYGQKIKQLVAREGQEVPPVLEEYVEKKDVTSELAKTRSLVGSSAAERRALVDGEHAEPDHADVRAAAAVTEPVGVAGELPVTVEPEDGKKARRPSRTKARKEPDGDKARESGDAESK
jgi:hypothetical protein